MFRLAQSSFFSSSIVEIISILAGFYTAAILIRFSSLDTSFFFSRTSAFGFSAVVSLLFTTLAVLLTEDVVRSTVVIFDRTET